MYSVVHWNMRVWAFVDDLVLVVVVDSEGTKRQYIEIWNVVLERCKIKVNKGKTKVMVIGEGNV